MNTDDLPELKTIEPTDLDGILKVLGKSRRIFHISLGGIQRVLRATNCSYEKSHFKDSKNRINTLYIEFQEVSGTGFAELMCSLDYDTPKATDYVCYSYRKRYTFDCPSTVQSYTERKDALLKKLKGSRSTIHRIAEEFPFVRNASDGTELMFYESAFGIVKSWNGHLSDVSIKMEYLDEHSSGGMVPQFNAACTYYETSHYRYEWWKDVGYARYGWTPPFYVCNVRGSQLIWRHDEMEVMSGLTRSILKLLWNMGIMYSDTASQRVKLKKSRILVYEYILKKFNPSGLGLPGLKNETILTIGFNKWKKVVDVQRCIKNIRKSLSNRTSSS